MPPQTSVVIMPPPSPSPPTETKMHAMAEMTQKKKKKKGPKAGPKATATTRADDADVAAGTTFTTTAVHAHSAAIGSTVSRAVGDEHHVHSSYHRHQQQQQQQHQHQQQHELLSNGPLNVLQHHHHHQQQHYSHDFATTNNAILNTEQSSISANHNGKINNMNMANKSSTSTSTPLSLSPSSKQILILGINITHLTRKSQFIICALGVFSFSLLYGYLQEFISVTLFNRQLGLFLAMVQFLGYTVWSKIFYTFVQFKQKKHLLSSLPHHHHSTNTNTNINRHNEVPFRLYLLLSILRAIDAGMTNMAMAYVNYPAKTLMKSSRVVFTMLFGSLIRRKTYTPMDYIVVSFMVSGLIIFMHADSQSSAIFQPLGIIMLSISLMCDGAISNMSEKIMNQYDIGQDEFIYNLYSTTVCGIIIAAAVRGDLRDGLVYLTTNGTYEEIIQHTTTTATADTAADILPPQWNALSKAMILFLFSSAGFFGSSCSALITKEFGALTMSITSTARKAMTLFLSFALFNNICTLEHIFGIFLFITALVAKSLRVSNGKSGGGGGSSNNSSSSSTESHHSKKSMDSKGHYQHVVSLEESSVDEPSSQDDTITSNSGTDVEMIESATKKNEGRVKRRFRRRRQQASANVV